MERGLNADTFGEIMKLNSQAEGGDRSAVIERMRQQFSLNYTNSAMLYDQWDEQTEHGTREMPKENAQTLVSAYGKEPPPANSPELDAAKTTEAIKNWWTQTGISHWDANFPDILLEELRKAIQEYNDETGSDVPLPPLPPLPSLSDIDTTGMTSLEIERQAQENYRAALKRGTGDNAERAYRELETAQMNALNPAPSIFDPENLARMEQQAQSSLSGLFSPGFALNPFKSDEQKGDRSGMNRTLDTVSGAIYSGDAGQIQAAKDVLDMLAKLPADVRKDWDKENTANALGGDGIAALRSDLRELIEVEINNGRVHVMVEEPRP
jgi:hypothetical protein